MLLPASFALPVVLWAERFCASLSAQAEYVLLLAMLAWGPGFSEPFLPQELAFLGKVMPQVDLLLLPLTIAVG